MSGIDTSMPDPFRPRRPNPVPRVPKINPTVRLEAPGLAIQPPTSETAQQAARVQNMLEEAGHLATSGSAFLRERRLRREQAQRQFEAELAQTEKAARGNAIRQARESLPEIVDAIRSNDLKLQVGGSPEAAADQIIAEETEGLSGIYAESFGNEIRASLIQEFVRQRRIDAEEARFELLNDGAYVLSQVGTADEARAAVASLREQTPGVRDEEVADAIQGAIMLAAQEGRVASVQSLLSEIPDTSLETRTRALARLAEARSVDATQRARRAESDIFAQMTDVRVRGIGSLDAVLESITAAEQRGDVSAPRGFELRRIVDNERESLVRENAARTRDMLLDQVRAEGVRHALTEMTVGRGAAFIEDIEIDLPSGTKTISSDELIEAARDQVFRTIDRDFPRDEDPARNMAEKVRFLGQNPTVRNPEWTRVLDGAARRVRPTSETGDIRAIDVQAFELYRTLKTQSPAIANAHADEETIEYFRLAEHFAEHLPDEAGAGTRKGALIAAARATFSGPPPTISTRLLDRHADRLLKKAKDRSTIRAVLEQRTSALVRLSGVSPEAAIERAARSVQEDYVVLNGWTVRRRAGGQAVLPANIEQVAGLVALYAGEKLDEDSNLVTLRPMPTGDWRLVQADTGLGVVSSPAFSSQDLSILGTALRARESIQARQTRLDAGERRRRLERDQLLRQIDEVASGSTDMATQQQLMHLEQQLAALPAIEQDATPTDDQLEALDVPAHLRPILDFLDSWRPEQRRRTPSAFPVPFQPPTT